MADTLAEQILLTISYTDQFQFPLTAEEVRLRLIPGRSGSGSFSVRAVAASLAELVEQQLLETEAGYYCLAGQRAHIQQRQVRAKISQQKWHQVPALVKLASLIPWIEGVFVTGSLAMDSAVEDDDIDILIVTRPGRLWLSRLLLVMFSSALGKRRAWNADVKGEAAVKDSWCFNLWLDQRHLVTLPPQRNFYLAYEILQSVLVFDRQQVANQFLSQNTWIRNCLPAWFEQKLGQVKPKPHPKSQAMPSTSQPNLGQVIDSLLEPVLAPLDWLVYHLQLLYMRPHMTTERVARGFAFFHPRSTKALFYQRWQYSLVQLLARQARARRERVVLATGVFDILHQEHRKFLHQASQQGELLLIGIESDARVRQMKGEGRPINTATKRQQNLTQLNLSNTVVFVLPEQFVRPEDHQRLIAQLRPDILAVSSHTAHLEKKQVILKKYGGRVKIVHQHNPAVSTTQILEGKSGVSYTKS